MSLLGYTIAAVAAHGGTKWGKSILNTMIGAQKKMYPKIAPDLDRIARNTLNKPGLFLKSFVPGLGAWSNRKELKQIGNYHRNWKKGLHSATKAMKDLNGEDTFKLLKADVQATTQKPSLFERRFDTVKTLHKEIVESFKTLSPTTGDVMKKTYRTKIGSKLSETTLLKMDSHFDKFAKATTQAEYSSRLMYTSLKSNAAVIGLPTLTGSLAMYGAGKAAVDKYNRRKRY